MPSSSTGSSARSAMPQMICVGTLTWNCSGRNACASNAILPGCSGVSGCSGDTRYRLTPPVSPCCQHARYAARSTSGSGPNMSNKRTKSSAASTASEPGRRNQFMYSLAACCAESVANALANVIACGELSTTNLPIFSGCCAAKLHATAPPQSCAITACTGAPNSLITAHKSATNNAVL